ncbi:hypothetical protein HGRIS_010816 [Hohenbuehelia grisea]|uniref:Hydrophobin n=1 Tax=Hohenbuehelia grisea TaxID=104357 RepID=A0ABR3IYD5_9AGAR
MFSRVAPASVLALPILAAAMAVVPRTEPASQCNTGSLQCCNSVQSSKSSVVGLLAGLLGIVLGPLDVLVGVTCSPISVIGVGGNSCTAQPVCCTGNSFVSQSDSKMCSSSSLNWPMYRRAFLFSGARLSTSISKERGFCYSFGSHGCSLLRISVSLLDCVIEAMEIFEIGD